MQTAWGAKRFCLFVGCGDVSMGKAFASCKHEDFSADPSTQTDTCRAWRPTCNFSNGEEETRAPRADRHGGQTRLQSSVLWTEWQGDAC